MKSLVFIFLFLPLITSSQISFNGFDFSAGINFEFGFNVNGGSYLSICIASGVKRTFYHPETFPKRNEFRDILNENAFVGFQASLNIYYNGLGDNILDKYKNVNIDLVNTFMLTAGIPMDTSKLSDFNIYVKPFNSQTSNVIRNDMMNSLSFGTNFILNNTNRNQRVGFLNLNAARVVNISYYNDGPPYDGIMGDGFDRWWTGGGSVDIHFTQYLSDDIKPIWDSKLSFNYDRFTGNIQDAFLSSNMMGFHIVPAASLKEALYNRSKFKVGWHFYSDNFEISYIKLGNLFNDVQNRIHYMKNIPIHYTYARGINVAGINYNAYSPIIIKL